MASASTGFSRAEGAGLLPVTLHLDALEVAVEEDQAERHDEDHPHAGRR